MASVNQTILIRTDLFQLPEDIGLISAQVAHIHFQMIRQLINSQNSFKDNFLEIKLEPENKDVVVEWLKDPYLLVKKVPNLEALEYFEDEAVRLGLTVYGWSDTVYVRLSNTQKKAFEGVLVGISIGPSDNDKIRTVLGDLPLL